MALYTTTAVRTHCILLYTAAIYSYEHELHVASILFTLACACAHVRVPRREFSLSVESDAVHRPSPQMCMNRYIEVRFQL